MLNTLQSFRGMVAIAILFFSLTIHGCGNASIPYGTVTGTVTLDGNPVPDVIINCKPLDQTNIKSAEGSTDKEGKFQLITSNEIRGVPIGKCEISLALPELSEGGQHPEMLTKIPSKYFQPFQQAEIHSGNNTIDLKLVTK